jgi:hypothetical protein
MRMNFEVTVQYQGMPITYTATPFDEAAYWLKLCSFAGDLPLPKLIFVSQEHYHWQSSCSDEDLVEQLINVLEEKTCMLIA